MKKAKVLHVVETRNKATFLSIMRCAASVSRNVYKDCTAFQSAKRFYQGNQPACKRYTKVL